MKKKHNFIIILIIMIIANILPKCKNNKDIILEKVHKRIGTEIYFDTLLSNIYDSNKLKLENDIDYIIVSYISKDDCTECSLKLNEWKKLINNIKKSKKYKIKLLIIISPKASHDANLILNGYTYKFPIYIDKENKFSELNDINGKNNFNTFLINREHRINLIGNPTYKRSIEKLYFKILKINSKEKYIRYRTKTNINTKVVDFQNIKLGHTVKYILKIKNTGLKYFYITDVKSSCGCINVNYSRNKLSPMKTTKLIITYKAREEVEFFETIQIYSNSLQNPIRVEVHGNVI